MTSVTRDQFYATVGQLNVHPSPQGNWDQEKGGYRVEWKLPNGRIVGVSQGKEYFTDLTV